MFTSVVALTLANIFVMASSSLAFAVTAKLACTILALLLPTVNALMAFALLALLAGLLVFAVAAMLAPVLLLCPCVGWIAFVVFQLDSADPIMRISLCEFRCASFIMRGLHRHADELIGGLARVDSIIMRMVLCELHREHRNVTIAFCPLHYDCRMVTIKRIMTIALWLLITLWPFHYDHCILIVASWPLHHDHRIVTIVRISLCRLYGWNWIVQIPIREIPWWEFHRVDSHCADFVVRILLCEVRLGDCAVEIAM